MFCHKYCAIDTERETAASGELLPFEHQGVSDSRLFFKETSRTRYKGCFYAEMIPDTRQGSKARSTCVPQGNSGNFEQASRALFAKSTRQGLFLHRGGGMFRGI